MIEFSNDNMINCAADHEVKELLRQQDRCKQLLDAITQSLPLAYLVVNNRDDSIMYFNKQFCRIWGAESLAESMQKGELKNNDVFEFCLHLIEDKPSFIETCRPLQDENNRTVVEDEILLTDGRVIRRFSGQVRDESDNYIGRLYVFEDITKFNAERQLTLEKLKKYKLLSEKANDIILFIGMDGKILEANESATKGYGYTAAELCSMRVEDLRAAEQVPTAMSQMEQAYNKGFKFETVHKRKDGSVFPVEVSSQGTLINEQKMLLSIIRDISERKQMQKQLEYIATHDYLTSLPNRFYLEEHLKNINRANKEREDAFLIIDLDNFKTINDSYGHETGDKILIDAAERIRKNIRAADFVSRIGGDEFGVFLSHTSLKEAQTIATTILHAIENDQYCIDKKSIHIKITASIGVTIIDSTLDVKRLFSYSDAALDSAKNEGKNRVFILENKHDKDLINRNNAILSQIQDALVRDKFQIYLQPIHKASDGILHHEVLVRMLGENNKIVPAALFIPLAERYGLMPLIDKWVIANTIKLLRENKDLNVFVNLSGTSLGDDTLLEWVESTLNNSDIVLSNIGFEITETTAIKDLEKTKLWIHKIKALGCNFALDDFGIGFSSFSYLNILPVDYLKIDGSFVCNLDSDPTKHAIVQAMNMVAHALGKKTIAEFVESEPIWEMLKALGVDYGQGYYLGKPEPFKQNSK